MGKEKLTNSLQQQKEKGSKLFVPYIMAGDGGLEKLKEHVLFLQDCGVAAIEVGIPFSDPVADGPTIQNAGKRALKHGTTLAICLHTLASFKDKRDVPIIVMTYVNPIFSFGIEQFAATCFHSGIDGVIIPDLPLEEESLLADVLQQYDITFIRLVSLTSPKERVKAIMNRAEGFLYAVTVKGTTGVRTSFANEVNAYLQQLKSQSDVPVLAGFGISTSEQAKALSSYCDGVVVGSKIVDLFHENKPEEIRQFILKSM